MIEEINEKKIIHEKKIIFNELEDKYVIYFSIEFRNEKDRIEEEIINYPIIPYNAYVKALCKTFGIKYNIWIFKGNRGIEILKKK